MWELDGEESWARRIDAFELWCWRRLLRVPWTARRSNQSILKEVSPWCSLEGLMLKLKLQYFDHLMQRSDSLEKTLMLGRIGAGREGDDRAWDGWMASLTWWTWFWVDSVSWWWTGRPGLLRFMVSQRVGHDWEPELNWTELINVASWLAVGHHSPCQPLKVKTGCKIHKPLGYFLAGSVETNYIKCIKYVSEIEIKQSCLRMYILNALVTVLLPIFMWWKSQFCPFSCLMALYCWFYFNF